MTISDNRPVDRHTLEAARSARRAVLRSGPGALARLIGNPVVLAQMPRGTPPASVIDVINSEPALPIREPLFDVLDEGDELLVVADLPGMRLMRLTLDHTTLHLQSGKCGDVHRCDLPVSVDAATLRWTIHNGILEVRVRKSIP